MGATGFSVTPLSLGGAYLGSLGPQGFDDDLAIATVIRALELGINLIDTSPGYGESERRLGLALEAWYAQGGRREDFVLETKTGTRTRTRDYSYDGTLRSVEESLQSLKTDYLDIVLVHDPEDLTPVLAPDGAVAALKALKAQGVIRAIGLGYRQHEAHRRCMETGDFQVSLTHRDFNLLTQTAVQGVLEPAVRHGVAVFNASATLNGLLGGRDPYEMVADDLLPRWMRNVPQEQLDRIHALWAWCQERNASLLAVNMQYVLRERRITSTLVGCATPEQVEEDVAACFAPLPETLWDELHADFGL